MDESPPLTSRTNEDAEPELGDEAPARGNALLRLLAEESDGRLVEFEPGRWYESKISPPPEA